MKKLPQLRHYWHNTSDRFSAINQKSILNQSDSPIPPTRSYGYGFFSNFPGRRDGKAVFYPDDSAICWNKSVPPYRGLAHFTLPLQCWMLYPGIMTVILPQLSVMCNGDMVWRTLPLGIGQINMNFMSAVWAIKATVYFCLINTVQDQNWISEWKLQISTQWRKRWQL